MNGSELSLDVATAIISASRAIARERALQPLALVVLDAGGYIVAAEREDGSPNRRLDIAIGKAHGAVSLGVGSRALAQRAAGDPAVFASLVSSLGSPLIAMPGGVLICDSRNVMIGAVGVSGDSADNDEAVAITAITSSGLIPRA